MSLNLHQRSWQYGAAVTILLLLATVARAEIVLLSSGKAVSTDSAYIYAHPMMRSVVFSSMEAREVAILPPPPYFVSPPPLLMRAPAPFIAYPPAVYQPGINAPVRPSNRDNATYSLARAHAFSQEFYYADTYANYGTVPVLYASPYGYGVMPYYPPVNARTGLNQPARPSNRDNATYNLERAHRFSMDAYKKP